MEKSKEKERPASEEWGKSDFAHMPAWVWVLAFFCCAAYIFVLYLVEYRLYRDVLAAGTIQWGIFTIILFAGIWYQSEIEPPKPSDKKPKWTHLAIHILFIPLGAYAIFLGFRERLSFVLAFQILFIFPTLLLPPKITKRLKAAHMLICMYALLLTGTFAGVLAAGYISQPHAAGLLRGQGYKSIAFQEAQKGEYLADAMPENAFLPEDMETSLYLFSGEKDGALWAAAVNPMNGAIVGETPVTEGSKIAHWVDPQTLDFYYRRWNGEIVPYEMELK